LTTIDYGKDWIRVVTLRKPGIYILRTTITNPAPHKNAYRRSWGSWTRRATFPKMRYRLETYGQGLRLTPDGADPYGEHVVVIADHTQLVPPRLLPLWEALELDESPRARVIQVLAPTNDGVSAEDLLARIAFLDRALFERAVKEQQDADKESG